MQTDRTLAMAVAAVRQEAQREVARVKAKAKATIRANGVQRRQMESQILRLKEQLRQSSLAAAQVMEQPFFDSPAPLRGQVTWMPRC